LQPVSKLQFFAAACASPPPAPPPPAVSPSLQSTSDFNSLPPGHDELLPDGFRFVDTNNLLQFFNVLFQNAAFFSGNQSRTSACLEIGIDKEMFARKH
jgi:hypothetical protein